jgi:hypothetical protein
VENVQTELAQGKAHLVSTVSELIGGGKLINIINKFTLNIFFLIYFKRTVSSQNLIEEGRIGESQTFFCHHHSARAEAATTTTTKPYVPRTNLTCLG